MVIDCWLQVARLACGGFDACHSVVVSVDGKCWAWGRNGYGQLGVGDKEDRDTPKEIEGLDWIWMLVGDGCSTTTTTTKGLDGVNDAMMSERSSFIELENGDLLACGDNEGRQLGVGSTKDLVLVPTRIQFIE